MIWNLFILRKKHPPEIADSNLPFISILIPARNEERSIRNILISLLEQDYPNYEVIVLNDNSEDKTGEIISQIAEKYPKLQSLTGKPLEKGWTGKSYACKQLYEAAKGEFIIFTDADTLHSKNSIRRSVELAIFREGDMLTVLPRLTMISLAEKIMMPMLMFTITLLLPFYFVDKKGFIKFSIGIGPFMLFKRSAYEKIGGHGSVKNALVEDVWLAREIKQNGLKLVVEDGIDILSVRMYRSFGEIWDGFSKNIYAGFRFSALSLFSVNFMYFILFFMPFVFIIIELFLKFVPGFNFSLLIYQISLLYFARTILSLRFNLGFLSAILHPLGAISVPVIAVNSWRWISSGAGAKWKGRIYNPRA